jgi:hypothetical protein
MAHGIYSINIDETKQAAVTLASAFQSDTMIQWLVGDSHEPQQLATDLFETWVNYTVRYGIALRTENFESIALRLKPGQSKLTLWKMFRSGMFKTPKIIGKHGLGRLESLSKALEKARNTNMKKQLFLYCWVLGTHKEKQHQGFGKSLVQETFKIARNQGVPCYLETVTGCQSEGVHAKFGYEKKSIISIPDANFTMTAMVNQLKIT